MNKILNKVIGFITTHSIEVSSFQPRFHAIPMRTLIVLRGERFRILRGAFAQKVLRRPSPLPKPNSSSVLEEQLRQRDYPHWTAWYPFTFYYSAIFPLYRKVGDFGNFPGWWADTVAPYCPTRPSQLSAKTVTKHCDRGDE